MASKLLSCLCNPDRKEQRRIHREVEKELKKQRRDANRSFKLLLLGTGGSGKSTFVKQMRIIHGNGYSTQEREYFKQLVFQNVFSALQLLVTSVQSQSCFSEAATEQQARVLLAINSETLTEVTNVQQNLAVSIWHDKSVREAFSQRVARKIAIPDSAGFFFEDLSRIFSGNYLPTLPDILRVRVPTTGITEYPFHMDGVIFRLVDVGGQRSERRKWIHCFEDCTSIIFVTACSEFDETLVDVDLQGREVVGNKMAESLALFQTIVSYPWFQKSSIILFLNKKDLLKSKVKSVSFGTHFPSYQGGANDYLQVRQHILEMFRALNPDTSRIIYPHFTCATDTENMRFVFNAVKETVIMLSLRQFNLM